MRFTPSTSNSLIALTHLGPEIALTSTYQSRDRRFKDSKDINVKSSSDKVHPKNLLGLSSLHRLVVNRHHYCVWTAYLNHHVHHW